MGNTHIYIDSLAFQLASVSLYCQTTVFVEVFFVNIYDSQSDLCYTIIALYIETILCVDRTEVVMNI